MKFFLEYRIYNFCIIEYQILKVNIMAEKLITLLECKSFIYDDTNKKGFNGKNGIDKNAVYEALYSGNSITITFDTDDSGGYNTEYYFKPLFCLVDDNTVIAIGFSFIPRYGMSAANSFEFGYVTSYDFLINGESAYKN